MVNESKVLLVKSFAAEAESAAQRCKEAAAQCKQDPSNAEAASVCLEKACLATEASQRLAKAVSSLRSEKVKPSSSDNPLRK